ncbi:MAG: NUMOD4 domain-containing protein [Candidatus Anammoxibacter sp.]
MKEIWKDVKGYEGSYQVSNIGGVKSMERVVRHSRNQKKKRTVGERIMKLSIGSHGYKTVTLYCKGIPKTHCVHRLVALVFIPNPENKPCINHINAIRKDNWSENLEWCTQKENVQHAINIGRFDQNGSNNHNAKLTETNVLEIRKNANNYTRKELSIEHNVTEEHISQIINKRRWKHI